MTAAAEIAVMSGADAAVARSGPRLVGPVSEAFLYQESEKCPRGNYACFIVEGRPDVDALRDAVRHAQASYPPLVGRIRERRRGLFYDLIREPVETFAELEILDAAVDGPVPEGGHGAALEKILEPRVVEPMAIHDEAPARFLLVRLAEDRHVLCLFFHHIACDASYSLRIYQTLFACYHELTGSGAPDWARSELMPSSQRDRPAAPLRRTLLDVVGESRRYRRHPVIQLGRGGSPTTARRHQIGIDLSVEETRRLTEKSKRAGATVNDFVSFAVIRGLDAWLGTPDGTFSFWLPVNLRSGPADDDRANFTSAINIDLLRPDRVDERRLAERFVAERTRAIASGRAFANYVLLKHMLRFAHLVPLQRRRPALKNILSRPCTIMLSNLGVILPERVDGRLTGESVLRRAGNLDIVDYDCGISTDDRIGHALVGFTFRGRFSLRFSAGVQVLDLDEMTRFMAALRERLTQ